LLVWYAFWFLLHLQNQDSRAKNQDRSLFPFPFFLHLPSHSSPLYCCLLSIYFFQYVKERFVSLQLPVRSLQLLTAHCKLPAANWLGGE